VAYDPAEGDPLAMEREMHRRWEGDALAIRWSRPKGAQGTGERRVKSRVKSGVISKLDDRRTRG